MADLFYAGTRQYSQNSISNWWGPNGGLLMTGISGSGNNYRTRMVFDFAAIRSKNVNFGIAWAKLHIFVSNEYYSGSGYVRATDGSFNNLGECSYPDTNTKNAWLTIDLDTSVINGLVNPSTQYLGIYGSASGSYFTFDGTDMHHAYLEIEWFSRTTACGASTSVYISPAISEGDSTLYWSGASPGVNNSIVGYDLYYRDSYDNAASWTDWYYYGRINTGSGSGSYTIPPNGTRNVLRQFGLYTIGSAGLNSGLAISSNALRKYPGPNAPSIPNIPTIGRYHDFDWSDATDPLYSAAQLSYEWQLSKDGGASWGSVLTSGPGASHYDSDLLVDLHTVGVSLLEGQYYLNTSCQIRVRTKSPVDGVFSSWTYSNLFTIDLRVIPSAPTTLAINKNDPYEGEATTFTFGRPTSYNRYADNGDLNTLKYYVDLNTADHQAVGYGEANANTPSLMITSTIGQLVPGMEDLSPGLVARASDSMDQWGPFGEAIPFTIKRYRAPSVIVTDDRREATSTSVYISVTDTGYGGYQNSGQVNKIQYSLDGGVSWIDANLQVWNELTSSFEISGLDAGHRYSLQVRAVNNPPANTALVSKTGGAYSYTILEFTPTLAILEDQSNGQKIVAARSLLVGDDFSSPVSDNGAYIQGDTTIRGNTYVDGRKLNPLKGMLYKGDTGFTWFEVLRFKQTQPQEPGIICLQMYSGAGNLMPRGNATVLMSGGPNMDTNQTYCRIEYCDNDINKDSFRWYFDTSTGFYILYFWMPQYTVYWCYATVVSYDYDISDLSFTCSASTPVGTQLFIYDSSETTLTRFKAISVKDYATGLTVDKYLGNTTHPDTLHTSGIYGIYGRGEVPAGSIGSLVVDAYSWDWVIQHWYPINETQGRGYYRMFYWGTTWGGWVAK